jgi:hypothetical protein
MIDRAAGCDRPSWARRAPASWSKLSAVAHRTTVVLLALALTALVACGGSSSGSKCAEIEAAYATALSEARSCDPATPGACSATRPDTPDDVCRCEIAVNPASVAPLDQLLGEFQAEQCRFADTVCNRACIHAVRECAANGSPPVCQ